MSKKNNVTILLYKVAQKKDAEAYAKLYDMYVDRIHRFVYYKIGSKQEAEDITSEVFLKAWDYITKGNNVKNVKALFYKFARNLIIDQYRMNAKRREVGEDEMGDIEDGKNTMEIVDQRMKNEELIKNLNRLKNEYKEVLMLKYIEGLKTREIAKIMERGQTAVRVLCYRALKRLKQIMEEQ